MKSIDLAKTLDELEAVDWGEPTFPSGLFIECHRLRKVPLEEFTTGDLRIMIGQKISLEYLVPIALKELSNDPFLMGNRYRGDLLVNVLNVPNTFWEQYQHLYWELNDVLTEIENFKDTLDEEIMPHLPRLRQLAQTF